MTRHLALGIPLTPVRDSEPVGGTTVTNTERAGASVYRGMIYEDAASPSGRDAGGRGVPSDAGSCGVLSPKSLGFLGDC
jgi:hypothetical protein